MLGWRRLAELSGADHRARRPDIRARVERLAGSSARRARTPSLRKPRRGELEQ